jgi:hypothetical protein
LCDVLKKLPKKKQISFTILCCFVCPLSTTKILTFYVKQGVGVAQLVGRWLAVL